LDNGNTATIAYNGNGAPLTLPFYSTTTAAGYDPEDRLETTGSPNGPSSYSRYDADGLRAWNYFTLLGVSYFLNDGGQPVEEEGYTGNGGYFNLFGATGLELRFSTAGGSPTYQKLTAYTYDPQGNLVQPVALFPGGGPARVRVEGSAAYDGFGLPAAQKVAEGQFDGYSFAYEPLGFGGQYGYYTDNSGLLLLTHRYYNPFTGEFVNRDPMGYGGGINLYGLAGNNPVNGSDPSGFDFSDYVKGMGDALNPIEAGKGLISFGKYLLSGHARGRAFGKAVLTGLNPVDSNATDRQQGQRVMSDGLLLVAGYGTLSKLRVLGAAGAIADATGSGGSLVRNGLNLSRHVVVDRMGPRGITEDMIKVTLRKGQPFWDPKNKTVNYILQNGMASGKSILVGQNPLSGKVTTAMTSSKSLINKRFIPIK
jgi:RHS repeat-associated protein